MASEACNELPTAKWNTVLTTIFALLISVIACSPNASILLAIYKKQSLHSVTNYFLAALAFGDFFVGAVALPLWGVRSLSQVTDEEHPLSFGVECVYVLSVAISTYSLIAVSLERYMGVVLPLRYSTIVTVPRFKCVVALVWVVACGIACLRLVIFEDAYWITFVSTVFFVPGVTISYCYFCIFKEVARQLRIIDDQSGPAIASQIQNKKASITVAIVIGLFYLTTLPALAFSIVEIVSSEENASCQEKQSFEAWGTWALGHFSWLTRTLRLIRLFTPPGKENFVRR